MINIFIVRIRFESCRSFDVVLHSRLRVRSRFRSTGVSEIILHRSGFCRGHEPEVIDSALITAVKRLNPYVELRCFGRYDLKNRARKIPISILLDSIANSMAFLAVLIRECHLETLEWVSTGNRKMQSHRKFETALVSRKTYTFDGRPRSGSTIINSVHSRSTRITH